MSLNKFQSLKWALLLSKLHRIGWPSVGAGSGLVRSDLQEFGAGIEVLRPGLVLF